MVRRTPEPIFSHETESNNTAFPGTISASSQKVTDGLLVDGDSTLLFNSHTFFGKGAHGLQRAPGMYNDLSNTLREHKA